MEMDEKNVNYLISRCVLLENKNSKQAKRIKGFEEYIEVQDQRIKDLKTEYLQQAAVIYDQEKENAAKMEKEIQDDLAQEFMYGHPYSNTDDPEYPDYPYPEEQNE